MGTEPWNEDRDAALRALLVERVAIGRALQEEGRVPSRPEPRRLQVAVVTTVMLVAVVAGSTATVLLAQQRPGGAPGSALGAQAPSPSDSVPPTPVVSPAPDGVLQTPSPVSTPDPTATPADLTGPGPVPTIAPTPTPPAAGPLIAPAGWHRISRAELHSFVARTQSDDPANAAIWEEQAWLDIRCMEGEGFLYDPIGERSTGEQGLTAEERRDYDIAMYGPQTSRPYDWRTAGCHGRSVHLTGQDHAN